MQWTILLEHWWVAFSRRYLTAGAALHVSLEAFLPFYSHDRPHQAYRVRGQTPAASVRGPALVGTARRRSLRRPSC